MYNNILLAADGSTNSLRATEETVKVASIVNKCRICVVVVVDFSQAKNEVIHALNKEELEFVRRKRILPIEEKLKDNNLAYEVKIMHGETSSTIVDYANKGKFDLVSVLSAIFSLYFF